MNMINRKYWAGIFFALWSVAGAAGAQGEKLAVSEDLLELLRAEMREVSKGMQALVPAITTNDWATVREVGHRIEQSYILGARLTDKQRAELKRLPEGFKTLDHRFHMDAAGLAEAAKTRDASLVQFRYERMFGGCMSCHEAYAPRFSGPPRPAEHSHGH